MKWVNSSCHIPWKHQKTRGFLIFLGGIERYQWHEVGSLFLRYPLKTKHVWFSGIFRRYRKIPVSWNGLTIASRCSFLSGFNFRKNFFRQLFSSYWYCGHTSLKLHRSGVFIVNFGNISYLFSVSVVDLEQVNVSWVILNCK